MAEGKLDRLLRGSDEPLAWETYHEASKASDLQGIPSDEVVAGKMAAMWASYPYVGYPAVELPRPARLVMPLTDAIGARETARDLGATDLSIEQVATVLFHTCGETRGHARAAGARNFRAAPSAGALYPLETYLHSNRIVGVEAGVHHYNPCDHVLRRIVDGDRTAQLTAALAQERLAREAALLVFITAVVERSSFKYGERAYRFALLEAGHMAQNFALAATAMGLGAVTIGGFFDQAIDRILRIDGLRNSTIYVLALGIRTGEDWLG